MIDSCGTPLRPLAHGPFCAISECRCGVLHVTIGALTIRLQPDVVSSIWETLGEAMRRRARSQKADDERREELSS